MTASIGRPGDVSATAPPNAAGDACDLNRKRSLFEDFLEAFIASQNQAGGQNCPEDDNLLVELLKHAPGGPGAAELINDLPGVLSSPAAAAGALDSLRSDQQLRSQSASAAAAGAAAATGTVAGEQHQHQHQQQEHRHHRAVITSMPAITRAAAGATGDDDDTTSAVTLPMPDRKRRRSDDDADEACSSPNDLVEVPAAAAAAAAAAGGSGPKRSSAAGSARTSGAGGATTVRRDAASSRDQQAQQAAATTASGAVAAAAAAGGGNSGTGGKRRGILVAKVLTKSDASSKRIILPRIAVETNLPQLGPGAQVFHFDATDPGGAVWPLVIKAWANGSNPKPVYVLEQVGEVLKSNRLSVGDAVALLADEDSGFFLEWNTPAAAAAASRPTFSGIVFKPKGAQQQLEAAPAAGAAATGSSQEAPPPQQPQPPRAPQQSAFAASASAPAPAAADNVPPEQPAPAPVVEAAAPAAAQPAAAAAPQQQQQQPARAAAAPQPAGAPVQQQQQQQPLVVTATRLPSVIMPEIEQTAQLPQHLKQQQPGAAAAPGPQQEAQKMAGDGPYMTAVPVTSPQFPGTFIPTSPCQLLVMGHMPMPDLDLDLDAAPQPSLPAGMLGGGGASGVLEGAFGSDDSLLVPTFGAAGSVLQCPRTLGCTRPAGHQGWCLGHKGYKKRRL